MKINPHRNITPLNNTAKKSDNKEQSPTKISMEFVNPSTKECVSAAELVGRCQTMGLKDFNEKFGTPIYGNDVKFLNELGKVFRLNQDEIKNIKAVYVDFINEYDIDSVCELRGDDPCEYANELGVLNDRLSEAMDLSDSESISLASMITFHIMNLGVCDDDNQDSSNKYVRDFTPFQHILKSNNITNDEKIHMAFDVVVAQAQTADVDNVFDIFKEDKIKYGKIALNQIQRSLCINDEKALNIMLDLVSCAKKDEKARREGFDIHELRNSLNSGMSSIVLAARISDELDIKLDKKLLNILEERNSDGCSDAALAYKLAVTYDMPIGAEKIIIKILNDVSQAGNSDLAKEFIYLLQTL